MRGAWRRWPAVALALVIAVSAWWFVGNAGLATSERPPNPASGAGATAPTSAPSATSASSTASRDAPTTAATSAPPQGVPHDEAAVFALLRRADDAFDGGDAVGSMQLYREIVEQHPDSKWAPYGLYKLAWTEANLGDVPRAIADMERLVGWFEDEAVVVTDSNRRLLEAAEEDLEQLRGRLDGNADRTP